MRVHAGLVLVDPALVDEALDEGVVAGELADLAVAEEVRAGVADVPHAEPAAVEEREGGRRAGAAERRVLVDQLSDPVVRAVQGVVDQGQQVAVAGLLGRRLVSRPRSCAIAVLDATSPRAAPPTPSQTAMRWGPAYPESWLSLRTRPTSEIAGEVELHFLSSRIVLPMRIWVPSVIVVGWVIRTVPM